MVPETSPEPAEKPWARRSEEHTSELQSPCNLACRLLPEKNAFSAHSQAQDKAAGGDGAPSANSPKIDRVVMWFAALTIVATTLYFFINPAQLAEIYSLPHLLLQHS